MLNALTPKETYTYFVVDRMQVIQTGTAETLNEFCEKHGFIIQQSFYGVATIASKDRHILFGVTWQKVAE